MIRKANNNDISKLALLLHEDEIISMQTKINIEYLNKYSVFVFVDKHKIKGCIVIQDNKNIKKCVVDKQFQNNRIGHKLIKYVQCRYNCMSSYVDIKNQKAINFYHKQGFKIIQKQEQGASLLMYWVLGCPKSRMMRIKGDS